MINIFWATFKYIENGINVQTKYENTNNFSPFDSSKSVREGIVFIHILIKIATCHF